MRIRNPDPDPHLAKSQDPAALSDWPKLLFSGEGGRGGAGCVPEAGGAHAQPWMPQHPAADAAPRGGTRRQSGYGHYYATLYNISVIVIVLDSRLQFANRLSK
jgi:hypothetical protein